MDSKGVNRRGRAVDRSRRFWAKERADAPGPAATRLHVVVPTYRSERWIGRTVESIRSQRDADFRCIVIDDCSPDATFDCVQRAAGDDPRFEYVRRDRRTRQLLNRDFGIRRIATRSTDVVVLVDGDDWLAHDRALARIAAEYADPEVWITYGSYRSPKRKLRYRIGLGRRRSTRPFPEEVVRQRTFRHWRWPRCHPMTFRRFLYDAIREEDLRDEDGEFYSAATDLAIMYPMFEMAGPARMRWIPDVIYHRNRLGPQFDDDVYRASQHRNAERLRSVPTPLYSVLESAHGDSRTGAQDRS